jgi:hypothetical protein
MTDEDIDRIRSLIERWTYAVAIEAHLREELRDVEAGYWSAVESRAIAESELEGALRSARVAVQCGGRWYNAARLSFWRWPRIEVRSSKGTVAQVVTTDDTPEL